MLRGVLTQQGKIRDNELPLFVAHVGRVNFAAHPLTLPQRKFMTGSSEGSAELRIPARL